MLLPIFLRMIVKLQGEPRHSDVERKVTFRQPYVIMSADIFVLSSPAVLALLAIPSHPWIFDCLLRIWVARRIAENRRNGKGSAQHACAQTPELEHLL
jgi:hypothetical protein